MSYSLKNIPIYLIPLVGFKIEQYLIGFTLFLLRTALTYKYISFLFSYGLVFFNLKVFIIKGSFKKVFKKCESWYISLPISNT